MRKIVKAAIKDSSGKVTTGDKHKNIPAHGKEGFKTNDGKFIDRKEAAKVANKAGQTNGKVKTLQAHMIKRK